MTLRNRSCSSFYKALLVLLTTALALSLLVSMAHASSLQWNPAASGDDPDGYIVYYWEGAIDRFTADDLKTPVPAGLGVMPPVPFVSGQATYMVADIETTLNLPRGQDVNFAVTAYNSTGQSVPATLSEPFTVPQFSPPAEVKLWVDPDEVPLSAVQPEVQ